MAIDFSQVKEVKYNNQDVTKIERSGVTLWEKVVDPTANLMDLSSTTLASYNSGNLHAIGRYNNELNNMSSFKVHWCTYDHWNESSDTPPWFLDANGIVQFPYKTSSSGSTMSKMGIGSIRANSSDALSSSSAQYGLTIKQGEDWSAYKRTDSSGFTYYSGTFTVTPGSSSTYPNKCFGIFALESLYGTDGSGQKDPDIDFSSYDPSSEFEFYIDGQNVLVPGNKYFKSNIYPYKWGNRIELLFAIEKE